ncbi:MAG: hydrogenase 4 subunit B [Magnetococcus sp. WYHC-3]
MTGVETALGALVVALVGAILRLGLPGGVAARLFTSATLALNALLALVSGLYGLAGQGGAMTLPLGLPGLPFQLRLDPLGGFMLLTLGLVTLAVAFYTYGYDAPHGEASSDDMSHHATPGRARQEGFFLPLFVAGMEGVLLANDVYMFMLFWELMSVASYFLVTSHHHGREQQSAGFLYLLMAHAAGLLILASFAVLYSAGGSFGFDILRLTHLSPVQATAAFLLALAGFGMKAGVVPLHVWLPVAHPAAPAHASALMSGVMIKIALFGFLRLVWDLMGSQYFAPWWGALVLGLGSMTAVTGVMLAVQQQDLKRLLAFSSVENIGIILIGLGLGMIFTSQGYPALGALGLAAALFHMLNHALFKGLLFMAAGAVVRTVGSGNMERMGGLIHNMPFTAGFFLVGSLAISGLPPLNGFVSEWLTFQAALSTPEMDGVLLSSMVPVSGAMLALAGALAAATFVKVFGIVFLGLPRSEAAAAAGTAHPAILLGLALPAALCLLLGMWPNLTLTLLGQVTLSLQSGGSLPEQVGFVLVPWRDAHTSYAGPVVLSMLVGVALAAWVVLHLRRRPVVRGAVWSCGHPHLTPSMQYSAASFSQPLRLIFSDYYRLKEQIHTAHSGHISLVNRIRHTVRVDDPVWALLYRRVELVVHWLALRVERTLDRGIHYQLGYMFVTLLILMGLFG